MAGELITQDWQMEYRDVLLGSSTPYEIVQVEGLMDLPEIQVSDRLRLRRHGLSPGDDFAGRRSITVTFEVDAPTVADLNTYLGTVADITRPGLEESPLSLQIPGVAEGGKRRANVRPRRRALPVNLDFYYGLPIVVVEFVATDPRIYTSSNYLALTALPSGGGGLLFPATPPLTFVESTETGDVNAVNDGSFPVNPVIRIDGPITNPTIENLEQSKTIEASITLLGGEYLLIDTESRTVLLNGTASRYSSLLPTSEWWDLAPGDNTIRFRSSTNTEDAVLSVSYRSAWV